MSLGIVLIGVPPHAEATIDVYRSAGYYVTPLAISEATALEDGLEQTRAAFGQLDARIRGGKVAVAGYGFGGRYAFLALTRLGADAAVALYGSGMAPFLSESPLATKPLSFHFGDADEHVPLEEVRSIKGWLEGMGTAEIYRYSGVGHGFALLGDAGYNAEAASQAERRVLAFLKTV